NVPRGCFKPIPNVDSAVIRMDLYDTPPVTVKSERKLFEIIKAAFSARRKTLLNSLFTYYSGSITKEKIQEITEKAGIDPNVRGEQLDLTRFAVLADAVYEFENGYGKTQK
ncbi:MAG: 16S rRNA (adenine(1518)-N(6)/adenine(1519)-N(6))-dimethyltransferase, partial [Clostridia bacterium]|nr:16S rRNA (adenine(1518)-N(6)/adenine(1519)-N(6))-dimethyltransferase [Clostridia bacterium]